MNPSRPGRTFELKVLVVSLLIISLASWLRVRLAFINWELLREYGAAAHPVYLALSAIVWGIASLMAAVSLYARQRWAPVFTQVTSLVLAAWYWVDRLALSQSPQSQQNWPFALGVTVIAVVFVFGTLALDSQKAFFEG